MKPFVLDSTKNEDFYCMDEFRFIGPPLRPSVTVSLECLWFAIDVRWSINRFWLSIDLCSGPGSAVGRARARACVCVCVQWVKFSGSWNPTRHGSLELPRRDARYTGMKKYCGIKCDGMGLLNTVRSILRKSLHVDKISSRSSAYIKTPT